MDPGTSHTSGRPSYCLYNDGFVSMKNTRGMESQRSSVIEKEGRKERREGGKEVTKERKRRKGRKGKKERR